MRVAVIGTGVAGLLSAVIALQEDHDVALVESEKEPGGLLRSVEREGHFFDYGTHIPRETGDTAIDSILFARMASEPWHELVRVRAGAYLNGTLFERTEFPSAYAFEESVAEEIWSELSLLKRPYHEFDNLQQQLLATFGETATSRIFAPMMRKFLGEDPARLAPDAHSLFTSRIVAGHAENTKRLKSRDSWWDQRIAFHDSDQHPSRLRSWYPSTGGAGRWVKDLVDEHLSRAQWIFDVPAVGVRFSGDDVSAIELADGRTIECDAVIWTVGIQPFLRAAGRLDGGLMSPQLRQSTLFHVLVSKRPETSLHYVTVYDPLVRAFRLTFYDNLGAASETGAYGITLEYLGSRGSDDVDEELLRSDLTRMGIVTRGVDIRVVGNQRITYGFPVPTLDFARLSDELLDRAAVFQNVVFVGKGAGRAFFLQDVLKEISSIVRSVV